MNEFYSIEPVRHQWVITPKDTAKYWIGYPIACATEDDAIRLVLLLSSQDLIVKGMREALKKAITNKESSNE